MADTIRATFRQGATHRPLRVEVFTEAAAVDFPAEFTGVTFRMVSGSTVITGTATGDSIGNLSYQWGATDLDIPGTYAAYFIGTDSGGRREIFPTAVNLEIVVVPTI